MASHTRFSGALAAIFLLSLPACGDATSATTATTVATTESTGPATATEATTDTTTTTTATTEAVTTTTGPTSSTSTTSTTSASETATGETTAVSATTADTTSTTDATTAAETSEGTTGEPMGATCEQDSDCQLHTDCCTCDVIAVGEAPPTCDVPECFVDVCSTLDLGPDQPECRFGRCTFPKVTCNPFGVTCNTPPPICAAGTLPSVKDDCWSGQCTPVEACDWAPDCAACELDSDPLVCVLKGQKGAYHVCEPKPAACGDAAEIDCECGQEICEASPPHTKCNDQPVGIECECQFC
ncbi:hypothetical protein [Nannocystis bainbridge]|uniref:Uncharacterized protein n=1 Tax=Nannocystis bainbridge TaxID=2995303 RepID=A0ABT5E614_9BACT|nr:hypothetical protein [Nannocystis bainbridge]MDC0721298.1 hypothetical protein [Nannocystis bainbridge]